MTVEAKMKAAQGALEALLDSEEILVTSEIGDYIVDVQATLHEAQKLAEAQSHILKIDNRELAAVLAGLRLVQIELPRGIFLPQGISDIYSEGGTLEPLTVDELDDLCERINCHFPAFAVIYDELQESGEWADNMYEIFDSIPQAMQTFLEMAGSNPEKFSNPRTVMIGSQIAPPEGKSWGKQ